MDSSERVLTRTDSDLLASIERFHDSMLGERVFESERLSGVKSPLLNVKEELMKDAIRSEILQYAQDLEKGYQILVREQQESEGSSQEAAKILIPREKVKELKESGKLLEWAQNGIPLYSLLGLSADAVYEIYLIVLRLLDSGDEEKEREALSVCRLLITLVPYVPDFWYAYALCLFRGGAYERVLGACEQTLRLDPRHREAALLSIRVLRDLGRRAEADARLGSFLEEAQRQSDSDAVLLFTQVRYQMG